MIIHLIFHFSHLIIFFSFLKDLYFALTSVDISVDIRISITNIFFCSRQFSGSFLCVHFIGTKALVSRNRVPNL